MWWYEKDMNNISGLKHGELMRQDEARKQIGIRTHKGCGKLCKDYVMKESIKVSVILVYRRSCCNEG
ncbi:hypothetical protein Hanom_Chr07g00611281 [Helianthus anomalus]